MRIQTLILLTILCFLVPSAVSIRYTVEWHPSPVIASHSVLSPKSISSSTASFTQLHEPIRIVSDSDFDKQAAEENWSGDGTPQHPYLIEGLQITSTINLIEICNTSVFFQISSCSLTHGRVGISLVYVSNGFLFNNTIFECFETGISLQGSRNCTLANSSIVSNSLGLFMSSCSNISIQYNSISTNAQEGIYSTDLANCTIFSNRIVHNERGIRIEFFLGFKILDNLVENNHNGGILVERNEILSRDWNGHEYRLISGDKTWPEAKLDCEARGGHLVTITNPAENTLVTGLAQMGSVWIGLTDEITEGVWQWVTGEPVNYTNWASGEPNDAGGEDYVELYSSGEWNDLPADYHLNYVCEWETIITPILLSDTVISGNQVINNTEGGIYTNEVQNIQISDNLIINSSYHGLDLHYTSFCNITQNQAIGGAIRFYGSGSNRITNNSVTGYGFVITGWEPSHYEQIAVVNNSVNGKLFIFWQSISDQVISEAGQVILIECSNITIGNQNISFTSSGIMGYACTNVTVTNSIFNNNSEYAVWFWNSTDCMISDNEMRYNGQGLRIEDNGRDISIINNTIEGSYQEGISLYYSEQIVLMKNTIRNNGEGGINLYRSPNSHLSNNTVSNNRGDGIRLYYSNSCILTNNTNDNNKGNGICLYYSHYNSFTNNSVINNYDQGIIIDRSEGNFINNNFLINNSFSLTGPNYEHYVQAEIVNNTINSKPIVYWLNVNGGTVPSGAGLIILVGSNAVTVENQSLVGVLGVYCSNVSIQNNLISNGRYGIHLKDSNDGHILNNTIMNIHGIGIDLQDTPNNTLINNTIIRNTGDGIRLQNSGDSFLTNNMVIDNGETGIRLEDCFNSILNANSVINNSEEGIYIDHSGYNSILNNFLVNNSFIITGWEYEHYIQTECVNNSVNNKPIVYWLHTTEETVPSGAAYVILVDCASITVVNQNVYGIIATNCWGLMIQSNIISNGSQGIHLRESSGSLISRNRIIGVNGIGIEISDSEECILTHNVIKSERGIKLWGSAGSSLINNTIDNSSDTGIYLGDSDSTILTNNTVTGNSKGIECWDSREGVLFNNHITSNEGAGIILDYSEYCTLSGNFITQNGGEGVFLRNSHNTSLTQNWIINNEGPGLVIGDSGWGWYYYYGGPSNDCVVVNNTISRNGDNGIKIQYSEYCVLMNNSVVSNNNTGILVESSLHCALYRNNVANNTAVGIRVVGSSWNILFSGNTIAKHEYYGISIQFGENNTVSYNSFCGNNPGNSSQASDDGWGNVFTNNFWDDWTSPDANGDGIVDVAYFIAGGANNYDQSPATTRHHLILGVLLSPKYEEPLSGVVTIQWVAVDLLDHDITYSIFYSTDGGEEWILMTTGLVNPFYNWDTTTLSDGSHYYLQIIANCSEGASCVFSSRVPFTIDNGRHIPPFYITYPEAGDIIIGTIEIIWSAAEDVFDHFILYTVLISPDNGQTWGTIVASITSLSCMWDSTTMSDGNQYIIQVIATCDFGSQQIASRAHLTVRNWPELPSTQFTQYQDTLVSFLGRISILFFIVILFIVIRRQQVK